MDSEPNGMNSLYLLAIRGTLSKDSIEDSRTLHNATAGAPSSVAAAQSLGDLSHMVYVPVESAKSGEFLILDIWNSMEGLNQFFANPQVQQQAGQIFSARDPVVWYAADNFSTYHIPSPYGKNDRFVSFARGLVQSRDTAITKNNAIVTSQLNKIRRAGNLSHEAYFKMMPPGTPESTEFLAVDAWMNASQMKQHFQDPEFLQSINDFFSDPPTTSMWQHPPGDWVEW
jgi:quinol monooxygenase YgiN